MERSMKCGCVVLAMILISLHANAQPLAPNAVNETNSNLPPLIFPKENVTIGTGLPPIIFPTENVTVGDSPIPVESGTTDATVKPTKKLSDAPLIFPKTNGSIPLIQLPPLVFPENDETTRVNQTALNILNAVVKQKNDDLHLLPTGYEDDYYKEDSSEGSDPSDEVEDVQPVDKSQQKDNLEENYKSDMNMSPNNDFDDIEVDHPMLRNTHILGVIGAVLAVLCVCLYLGITIWRRVIFNRYGTRERLINEEDFYSNKSIHQNF